MTNSIASEKQSDPRPTVIALHCSGGTGHQWHALRETLGDEFSVVAPDLIGCGSTGHWSGDGKFSLSIEAAPIVKMINAAEGPVHLVGHSYGGCVALRAASERAERIASLTLYEPVSFHMLAGAGPHGEIALNEITSVFGDILRSVEAGALEKAAEYFADYWNGTGAFAAAPEKIRAALIRYIRKAPLDYQAVMSERLPFETCRRFTFPILLMHGERTRAPTRLIAEQLGRVLSSPVERIKGAAHMGPLTHADTVLSMIAGHLRRASIRKAMAAAANRDTPAWA